MKYHIIKASRIYGGKGYCGVSSNNIPLEFETLHEAKQAIIELLKVNSVGWMIYDSITFELINK